MHIHCIRCGELIDIQLSPGPFANSEFFCPNKDCHAEYLICDDSAYDQENYIEIIFH